MEEALHQIGHDVRLDPLADLHRAILYAMQKIASDDQFRRVFEMSTFKVEYVDDLLAVKSRQLQVQVDVVCQMQRCLRGGCQCASGRTLADFVIDGIAGFACSGGRTAQQLVAGPGGF